MDKLVLKTEIRKIKGRKVETLRKIGVLPVNIYGKHVKSVALQVLKLDFDSVFAVAGETSLVELVMGKDKKPVLVHNVQRDPVSNQIIHADLLQVNLKEKVSTFVPIEIVGESEAENSGAGTVIQQLNEIEVEALPKDLPEKFTIDKSRLKEVDQAIFVKDLKYDNGKVELKVDREQIIVKVEPKQKEEVAVAEAPVEVDVVEQEEKVAQEKSPEGAKEDKTQL